ncbi:hypothetical protein SLE2022_345900 [Rubroshorea leprosula]
MSSNTEIETHTKTITLKTADRKLFTLAESVAMEFKIVKSFFDDNPDASSDAVVPLPNVNLGELAKISFCCEAQLNFRSRGESAKDESKAQQRKFLKQQTNEELKSLILAANFLEIEDFLDVVNQEAADRIKNKSVEYVRRFFGIENDYTPEEEAKVRAENAWAFEGVDPDSDVEPDEDVMMN